MKTCSKCKRLLDFSCFVKSARYSDGLYPSCKECRKKVMTAYLESNPLCSKCKTEPHMKGVSYCRTCLRIVNNLPIERERPNVDRNNKTMCCKCKKSPRRKGGHYCIECANEMQREWWKINGKGYHDLNREKANARQLIHWLLKSGKMKKQACSLCGDKKTEPHHHKGYSEEHRRDVVWLCKTHHVEADRKKRVDSKTGLE